MIANIIMLGLLVWSGYKAFTADTKDDALIIMIFVCIPILLVICGVHSDTDLSDQPWE
jgi:hypothetical protein